MLELYIKIFIGKEDTFVAFMGYFGHVINGSDNFSPKSADNLWNEQ